MVGCAEMPQVRSCRHDSSGANGAAGNEVAVAAAAGGTGRMRGGTAPSACQSIDMPHRAPITPLGGHTGRQARVCKHSPRATP